MTTTFETIRNQQASVLEALTPTYQSGVKFIRHRDRSAFMAWVEANPNACLRRFQILSTFQLVQLPTADGSIEGTRERMELRIAYPLQMGRYGAENEVDMQDVMKADFHQIDAAIGLNGFANYVSAQHDCHHDGGSDYLAAGDAARVMSVTYELLYDRSV